MKKGTCNKQVHLTKAMVANILIKPKKIQMTGAEFINTRDLTGR
jgi:hypothetical protein